MTVDTDTGPRMEPGTEAGPATGPDGTTGDGGVRPAGQPGLRRRFAVLLTEAAERLAPGGAASGGTGTGTGGGGGGDGRTGGSGRARRRWSRPKRVAVAVVTLVVLVIAVAALAATVQESYSDEVPAAVAPSVAEPYPFPGASGGDAASGSDSDIATEDAQRSRIGAAAPAPPSPDGTVTGPEPVAPAPSAAARPDGVPLRIVRTGSAVLEVRAGRVDAAVRELSAAATGLGGYTSASESSGTPSTSDDVAQNASITLRVPTGKFDDLRGRLADIGTVTSSTVTSQDVTGEYVDLEARKRALEASRNTYLGLLADATNVGDTLAVQQQIDNIQVQIEQIEGQRQVLADSSDLATFTVQVVEEGESVTVPEPGPSGLSGAFERSWDRFVGGLEAIIAATGPVALVALVLGALYGAFRVVRAMRRRRRAVADTPATPPAAAATPPGTTRD